MEAGGPEVFYLLFLLALAAAAIDAMAGGGGLLTLPGLMSAGLDPLSAFATNKLQSVFGPASATLQFRRKGRVRFRDHLLPAATCFVSAACGAACVSILDPGLLKSAIPFVLIGVAVAVIARPDLGEVEREARLSRRTGALTVIPLIAFYDGFLGPGTGSFFALAAVAFLGAGLAEATISAKIYNFMSNLGALLFFISGGHASWTYGAAMAAGTVIGGNIGARLVLKHGARIIRPVLFAMSLAMSVKLLWRQG
jgi:uncharacterized membrane protein YfcA